MKNGVPFSYYFKCVARYCPFTTKELLYLLTEKPLANAHAAQD
jgi:hypothetical protein